MSSVSSTASIVCFVTGISYFLSSAQGFPYSWLLVYIVEEICVNRGAESRCSLELLRSQVPLLIAVNSKYWFLRDKLRGRSVQTQGFSLFRENSRRDSPNLEQNNSQRILRITMWGRDGGLSSKPKDENCVWARSWHRHKYSLLIKNILLYLL